MRVPLDEARLGSRARGVEMLAHLRLQAHLTQQTNALTQITTAQYEFRHPDKVGNSRAVNQPCSPRRRV